MPNLIESAPPERRSPMWDSVPRLSPSLRYPASFSRKSLLFLIIAAIAIRPAIIIHHIPDIYIKNTFPASSPPLPACLPRRSCRM